MELLVSISIMTFILTTVLLNQSKYVDGAALSSDADELSSTIAEAQVYGVGVRELTPGSNDFDKSYGVSVTKDISGSSIRDYAFFADIDDNKSYTSANYNSNNCNSSFECLRVITLRSTNFIQKICAKTTVAIEDCTMNRVDITFTRPKTGAQINFVGASIDPNTVTGARVVTQSPAGAYRSIIVYKTGQTSINNTSGPSCAGTYDCSQWDGNQAACTGNGHACNWNPVQSRCNGGVRSCDTLTSAQCGATPNACIYQ